MYGWYALALDDIQHASSPLPDWLSKPHNLTQALRQHHQHIELNLLDQTYQQLPAAEAELLDSTSGLVRQIYLTDGTTPLTYGRTIIPQKTLAKHAAVFEQLGNKPIGETLLYNNPEVSRSAFEFGYVTSGSLLYQAALQQHTITANALWGRRSIFSWAGMPLLIIELFFPNLPPYTNET